MPKTRSGKWSVWFGIVLVIAVALSLIFAAAIGGDPAVIASSPLLSMLTVPLNLTLNLAGLLSLIVGIYTVIRYKEWSIWKPLALLYVLTVLLFLSGEFLFPH